MMLSIRYCRISLAIAIPNAIAEIINAKSVLSICITSSNL